MLAVSFHVFTPVSGVCPRDLWLICFPSVWTVACFFGIAACRVYGGRYAQQQILPRKVRCICPAEYT